MKIKTEIDLRKSDPLGMDTRMAFLRMRDCYRDATRMGPGDSSKPGWHAHNMEWNRKLTYARDIHALLRAIAKIVGPDATKSIPALKWANEHNFNGQPITPQS